MKRKTNPVLDWLLESEVTQMLRKKGVVGKFVEFIGAGLSSLPLADRATIANMAPEYGATMGFFPIDEETIRYLRFTGRDPHRVALAEAYYTAQGLFHSASSPEPEFSDTLELDLSTVEPSLAGPKRPQDRIALSRSKTSFRSSLVEMLEAKGVAVEKDAASRWVSEQSSAPGILGKSASVHSAGSAFTTAHTTDSPQIQTRTHEWLPSRRR